MACVEALIVVVTLLFIVIFKLYRFTVWGSKPGPNPFGQDCRRPAKPLVLNQAIRDRVLKQGFTAKKVPADLDVIVIGSGLGGLAVANILSKVGKRVLVLEQHDKAGGCCHTFTEKGFEFDVGLHYIGNVDGKSWPGTLMDQMTEGQLQWNRLNADHEMLVMGKPGNEQLYPLSAEGSDNRLKSQIDIFPHEAKVINDFNDMRKKVSSKHLLHQVMMKMMPKWIVRLLIKTGLIHKATDLFQYSKMSLQDVVDNLTDNNALKTMLSFNIIDHFCLPSEVSFSACSFLLENHLSGFWYPRGGASEIPFHMIPVIERAGGKVLVRALVTEILAENGRVVGVKVRKSEYAEDTEIRAPLVISDAGVINTFTKLLPRDLANKSSIYKMIGEKVEPGRSFLSLFVGLNGTTEDLNLHDTTYWTSTSENIDQALREYLDMNVEEAVECDAPHLLITFPSAKDPTYEMRHPGKSVCIVLAVANWEWFAPWENNTVKKRGADYEALKSRLKERLWRQTSSLFPQLADKVDFLDLGTPVSNNHYLNVTKGEFTGLGHTKERFGCPDVTMNLRPDTGIPGLLLTGQDLTGNGVITAAFSGVVCASVALHRDVFKDLRERTSITAKQK